MRAARTATYVLIALAIALGFGSVSLAFHDGGVGECVGCHNMHGAVSTSQLLVGSDASSACLSCHQREGQTSPSSFRVSTSAADLGPGIAPFQRSPGGDFGWLRKTYTWTVRGNTVGEAGQTHGHNIVAADFGYVEDSENTSAPGGGSLSASELSCTSCHDPHGKYRRIGGNAVGYSIATTGAPIIDSGSYATSTEPTATEAVGVYRLLAGKQYEYDTGSQYSVDPPHAVAPNSYNKSEASVQVRMAYGNGMSAWCATCHPDMLSGTASGHHPVGVGMSGTAAIYADYVASGDLSGDDSTAYLSLVPFEDPTADYDVLQGRADSSAATYAGPEGTGGNVNCLSCHRAHASGFEYALRWNPESEFLTLQGLWPGIDNAAGDPGSGPQFSRGRTEAEMQAAYYDRDASVFATYQRSLCNKCHAQD